MTTVVSAYPESAHIDRFTLDQLPPADSWPELIYERPEFRFPTRLNCVAQLLAQASGDLAELPAVLAPGGFRWDYRSLDVAVNQIAHVLTDDLGLVPGNRVLVRGWNTPVFAAIWLAVVKAGGVVVPTMPLLRAKELQYVIEKARVTQVLCEGDLEAELVTALRSSGHEPRLMMFDAPFGGDLAKAAAAKPSVFDAVDTWSGDPCLIAFTSGTTGPAKGTPSGTAARIGRPEARYS